MSLILGLASAAALASEAQLSVPEHNPFERPAWLTDAREAAASVTSRPGRPRFDLRATLQTQRGGLANLGGTLIAVGETYQNFRLVAVGDGVAFFSDGAENIEVAVNREDVDREED